MWYSHVVGGGALQEPVAPQTVLSSVKRLPAFRGNAKDWNEY